MVAFLIADLLARRRLPLVDSNKEPPELLLVELITNDNALYAADRMNALLELMAKKRLGFRF